MSLPFYKVKLELRKAAGMGEREAQELVKNYYSQQALRIVVGNQIFAATGIKPSDLASQRAAEEQASGVKLDKPYDVSLWFYGSYVKLEAEAKKALKAYADSKFMGQWAQGIVGIGPVLAAALMAHIDIRKAPTVGHIWSFGGNLWHTTATLGKRSETALEC